METLTLRLQEVWAELRAGELNVVLARFADIMLALLVIMIIGIMIIPIPHFLLDILLTTNMAIAISVLMICLYIPDALALSAFPTILLVSTLFRLALEVSATRSILLHADAGEVIHSFGNFVVAGNLIVGFVIFLIITLLQLIVIAKGAERVSEVSARFTLDAMPGKQMSIDADLRAGLIEPEDAKRRRKALEKESSFHGAMDGAMKFVKGDTIAGLIIAAINIIAGIAIGILMKGYAIDVALKKYTILTIGSGLVAQIPSLIITVSSAVLTTRVAGNDEVGGGTLGKDLGAQMLAQPTAIMIAAGMMAFMGIIPGMPTIPFLCLAGITGAMAYSLMKTKAVKQKEAVKSSMMEKKPSAGGGNTAQGGDALLPVALPIVLETSPSLTPYVDVEQRGERFASELLPQMRYWLFQDIGLVCPGVRIRGEAGHLPADQYAIYVHEVPIALGMAAAGHLFVGDQAGEVQALGITGTPGVHPVSQKIGLWVPENRAADLQGMGVRAIPPDEYMAVHLSQLIRKHADEMFGVQEVQNVLDGMEQQGYAALVKHVVPKLVSVQRLTDILRRLVREEISIKNMKAVLEALAEWAPFENDPVYLTEYVRMSLKRYIAYKFSNGQPSLPVYLLDPSVEQPIQAGIRQTASGSTLSLDPQVSAQILAAFRTAFERVDMAAVRPIVLTQMETRYFAKRLSSFEFANLVFLSFQELPSDMQIQPIGRIQLAPAALPGAR